MAKVVIRSAYDDPYKDPGLTCSEPTLTKQSEAEACDINNIVKRFQQSGGAIDLQERVGQYADVANIPDYKGCLDFIAQAQAMFMMLPSMVRERFENDPGQFLDFVQNSDNSSELVSMGLATAKEPVVGAGPSGSPSAPTTGGASTDAPIATITPGTGAGGAAQ